MPRSREKDRLSPGNYWDSANHSRIDAVFRIHVEHGAYQSLNDRMMALRDGKPLELKIEGKVDLATTHPDVMLEAAATSFQIHLQGKPESAVRDFNASIVASAPLVAASANSPYLFGHELWHETRIPLFEQTVNVGDRYLPRVSLELLAGDQCAFTRQTAHAKTRRR